MRQGAESKVTVGIPTYNRSEWLRESIQSVLAQSYRDFRLLVSDNASTDDTSEVVASFDDSRILYTRTNENIGMTANFNRVIELAESEFVALLYDDDLFYPEYLEYTVAALESRPHVGVVHTAFDLIDRNGHVLERARTLVKASDVVSTESGPSFIERSMRQDWVICSPSALFRTEAIRAVGCFPVEEEPLPDVPMLRRIALRWDLASVSRPLVAFRVHGDAASAGLGSFTGVGYETDDSYAQNAFRQRTQFIDEANLPPEMDKHYRSIADASLRRDGIQRVANQAGFGNWRATNAALLRLVREDPRSLRLPVTWRLVAAQLGARRARRFLHRLTHGERRTEPQGAGPGGQPN